MMRNRRESSNTDFNEKEFDELFEGLDAWLNESNIIVAENQAQLTTTPVSSLSGSESDFQAVISNNAGFFSKRNRDESLPEHQSKKPKLSVPSDVHQNSLDLIEQLRRENRVLMCENNLLKREITELRAYSSQTGSAPFSHLWETYPKP